MVKMALGLVFYVEVLMVPDLIQTIELQ